MTDLLLRLNLEPTPQASARTGQHSVAEAAASKAIFDVQLMHAKAKSPLMQRQPFAAGGGKDLPATGLQTRVIGQGLRLLTLVDAEAAVGVEALRSGEASAAALPSSALSAQRSLDARDKLVGRERLEDLEDLEDQARAFRQLSGQDTATPAIEPPSAGVALATAPAGQYHGGLNAWRSGGATVLAAGFRAGHPAAGAVEGRQLSIPASDALLGSRLLMASPLAEQQAAFEAGRRGPMKIGLPGQSGESFDPGESANSRDNGAAKSLGKSGMAAFSSGNVTPELEYPRVDALPQARPGSSATAGQRAAQAGAVQTRNRVELALMTDPAKLALERSVEIQMIESRLLETRVQSLPWRLQEALQQRGPGGPAAALQPAALVGPGGVAPSLPVGTALDPTGPGLGESMFKPVFEANSLQHSVAAGHGAPIDLADMLSPSRSVPGGTVLAADPLLTLADAEDSLAQRFGAAIAHRLIGQLSGGQWRARFGVTPSHLGPLEISMAMRDGQLDVDFRVAHGMTRELLNESFSKLREALADAGFEIGRLAADAGAGRNPDKEGDRSPSWSSSPRAEPKTVSITAESGVQITPAALQKSVIDYLV